MKGTLPFPPVEIGRPQVSPHWCVTRDGDLQAMAIFLRHYSARQGPRKVQQFTGPGEKLVLIGLDADALWVWQRNTVTRLDGQTGVCCAVFRNEGNVRSSLLIREAMRLAWERWPGERLFTFVDAERAAARRSKRSEPGHCFIVAGWTLLEERTKENGLRILEAAP